MTINLGKDLELRKGEVRDGIMLFGWDAVQNCHPSTCPVRDRCVTKKKEKCVVQMQYLETVVGSILKRYKYLDETTLFKIGMHLLPLYSHLCRLKILEMTRESVDDITYTTPKGMIVVHPVYKEIRETLKAIHVMWRDLDLGSTPPDVKPQNGNGDSDEGDNEHGDPSYYKQIENQAPLKRRVIR